MRKIKFRIWDKELEQMLYTTNIEWYDDSFGFRLNKHTEDIEYNLMQYTGLNDRNGIEIYEGDIVWILNDSPQLIKLDKGVVEMIDGCWQVNGYSLYSQYKVMVVGNIYQDKDKLE